MYHPVYSSTSWTDTDPIYTEMSPLLKTLGHHSSSNFHSNCNNSSKYTCESCSDYTYAHFFLRCVCGKYTCCSCYHEKACCICNLPFSCNSIFTATSRYYEVLRQVRKDSRNRSELVLLKRWLELLQT